MHELALTQGIISIVNSEAAKNGFTRVLEISLKVGEYSGVVPECLMDFFPYASKDTHAEGAELKIVPVPARFTCSDCGFEGSIKSGSFACPCCGGSGIKMTAGREFFVENLKVE